MAAAVKFWRSSFQVKPLVNHAMVTLQGKTAVDKHWSN